MITRAPGQSLLHNLTHTTEEFGGPGCRGRPVAGSLSLYGFVAAPRDHHMLLAPVELVRLARIELQRHVLPSHPGVAPAPPLRRVVAHHLVARPATPAG